MKRKEIIKHYKAHFGLLDIPFNKLGKDDKLMIEWAEDLTKNLILPVVSHRRELLNSFLRFYRGDNLNKSDLLDIELFLDKE